MKIEKDKVYYLIVDNVGNNSHEQAIRLVSDVLKKFNYDLPIIKIGEYGKPYFVDSNIKFNYSHSKKHIAVAISLNEVGIDIEDANRVISDSVSDRYLKGIKQDRLKTWVMLESYSKLKGIGLGIDFNSIELNNINESNLVIENDQFICSIYGDKVNLIFVDIKDL